MRLEVPFKKLQGGLDVTALTESISLATETDWLENKFRQERFEVATDVETILFKMNGHDLPPGEKPNKTFVWEDVWSKWSHLVEPVIEQATKGYIGNEKMFVNKCMIARLRPDMTIPEHTDASASFNFSHRIHVPLMTNSDVEFMVDGKRCLMEVGNAYELNNKVPHSVINKGSTPRIHLLFDIYIPKQ